MATTIDNISNGRLEFGIGAGWSEREHHQYGYDYPPLRVRAEMLEEAVQIAVEMWTQDEPTFIGKHYRIDGAACWPKPVQKPHPPVWIGGGAEKRILPVTARVAQWANFGAMLDEVPHKVAVLRSLAEAEGRPAPRVSLFTRMFVAEGHKGDEYYARGLGRPGIAGRPEQCAEQMIAYARAGVDYFVLTEVHKGPIELAATVFPMVRAALV
jgi:alkanesulfonate monooxygenase SsuD/methylene tetrahydromethanopterin reductase-like flavin-dependent oxidoreductase (luciferase family)